MNQRLSRQEIKRNEFAEAVETSVDFVQDHLKSIVAVLAGAVVLAIGVVAFLHYRSSQAAKAAEALTDAMEVAAAPIVTEDAKPEDPEEPSFADEASRRARAGVLFREVVENHGGTPSGRLAKVYLGRFAAADGDLAGAREYWSEFLDGAGNDVLAAEVRMNLLRLDLQEGKIDETVSQLEAMLDENPKVVPEDVLLYELAELLAEQGKPEKAVTHYQRIIDEFPRSPYRPDAQQKADSLGAPAAAA